jgi:hypothetical protein
MQKWVQMGYNWVIGLGWVIEGGTQNPIGWVLGRILRPKMGSAEVYNYFYIAYSYIPIDI